MTDAAKKIAERVPLPEPHESAVVCLTPEGYAHGNMLDVQLQVPQGTGMRRGDVLYTAAQMEALRLAVAAEALRGAEAVALIAVEDLRALANGRSDVPVFTPRIPVSGYVPLFTTPPAGSVEVTDAMVERLRKIIRERWGLYLGPKCARAALTAALQEKDP